MVDLENKRILVVLTQAGSANAPGLIRPALEAVFPPSGNKAQDQP